MGDSHESRHVHSLVTTYPEQGQLHLQEIRINGKKQNYWIPGYWAFLTITDHHVVKLGAIKPGPEFFIKLVGGSRKHIPKALVPLGYRFGERSRVLADVLLGNNPGNLKCHYVGTVTRSQTKVNWTRH